jgi:hypothetical protein
MARRIREIIGDVHQLSDTITEYLIIVAGDDTRVRRVRARGSVS